MAAFAPCRARASTVAAEPCGGRGCARPLRSEPLRYRSPLGCAPFSSSLYAGKSKPSGSTAGIRPHGPAQHALHRFPYRPPHPALLLPACLALPADLDTLVSEPVADCRMPERVLTDLCPAQYAECAPDLPRIVVWLASRQRHPRRGLGRLWKARIAQRARLNHPDPNPFVAKRATNLCPSLAV